MTRVLVAPLDWGLGHATRCIPVIRELQSRGVDVLLAGNGDSLLLMTKEFPELNYFSLPGYQPEYPINGKFMAWKMAVQIPKFLNTISEEHRRIETLVIEQKIDFVISDNRYGCWSQQVPSAFITHQSNILMPKRFGWMGGMIRRMNERLMRRFTVCWIPDFPGENSLAGKLAEFGGGLASLKARHVGMLSRFENNGATTGKYDVLAIFSGPEPQRSLLEDIVYLQLKNSNLNYFVVRGMLSDEDNIDDARVVNYMTSEQLEQTIRSAEVVIARSGYSTVMDLAALQKKKVIFLPTPGQTEQEYLAFSLKEKNVAYSVAQGEFSLRKAMEKVKSTTGLTGYTHQQGLLKQAIDEFITKH